MSVGLSRICWIRLSRLCCLWTAAECAVTQSLTTAAQSAPPHCPTGYVDTQCPPTNLPTLPTSTPLTISLTTSSSLHSHMRVNNPSSLLSTMTTSSSSLLLVLAVLLTLLVLLPTPTAAAPSATFPSYSSYAGKPYNVSYDNRSIRLNNQHVIFLSGSIHYPRSTPGMWPGLMQAAAADGLNMIEIYGASHTLSSSSCSPTATRYSSVSSAASSGVFTHSTSACVLHCCVGCAMRRRVQCSGTSTSPSRGSSTGPTAATSPSSSMPSRPPVCSPTSASAPKRVRRVGLRRHPHLAGLQGGASASARTTTCGERPCRSGWARSSHRRARTSRTTAAPSSSHRSRTNSTAPTRATCSGTGTWPTRLTSTCPG